VTVLVIMAVMFSSHKPVKTKLSKTKSCYVSGVRMGGVLTARVMSTTSVCYAAVT
jgi:esterase/lipase